MYSSSLTVAADRRGSMSRTSAAVPTSSTSTGSSLSTGLCFAFAFCFFGFFFLLATGACSLSRAFALLLSQSSSEPIIPWTPTTTNCTTAHTVPKILMSPHTTACTGMAMRSHAA